MSARVLDAFPVRATVGPSTLAVRAGLDLAEVRGSLAQLLAAGFIEPAEDGWRLTRLARS
jgi:DNA processing protein